MLSLGSGFVAALHAFRPFVSVVVPIEMQVSAAELAAVSSPLSSINLRLQEDGISPKQIEVWTEGWKTYHKRLYAIRAELGRPLPPTN